MSAKEIESKSSNDLEQPHKSVQDKVDADSKQRLKKEINGPRGLEPTRYGDWESKGRCYDF